MTRAELTEKLLDIKREKGWTWKYICDEIGGMSPVLITGAVLGQMKMTKPQAAKAAEMFGLSKSEQVLLNEVPNRGSPMPPTDPLIYRFYELVMVNGPALKVLIEEEFGENSATASCRPSTSICRWNGNPIPRGTGCGSRCPENSCRTNITAQPATRRRTDIRKNNSGMRFPGAAQHEVVRCRPGTVTNSESGAIPDQRCTTSCCTASGKH